LVREIQRIRNYSDEHDGRGERSDSAQIAVYPVDPRGMETQALFDPESRGKAESFFGGSYVEPREQRALLKPGNPCKTSRSKRAGKVCLNNNDLSECVKRAIDDSSSYYELTYYPTDKDWRGEFRKISVKTTRPGVQLSYREGYFCARIGCHGLQPKTRRTRILTFLRQRAMIF